MKEITKKQLIFEIEEEKARIKERGVDYVIDHCYKLYFLEELRFIFIDNNRKTFPHMEEIYDEWLKIDTPYSLESWLKESYQERTE